MNRNVFLSYSHDNKTKEPALKIANSLNEMGLHVWLDQLEIKVGESWKEAVEKGINDSSCVIALVSPHDKESLHYQEELQTALSKGKPIFPVIINNASAEDLPEPIKDKQAINVSNSYAELVKLYEAIDGNRSMWSKVREYLVNR